LEVVEPKVIAKTPSKDDCKDSTQEYPDWPKRPENDCRQASHGRVDGLEDSDCKNNEGKTWAIDAYQTSDDRDGIREKSHGKAVWLN
jgi:hypothetical protein